MRRWLVAIGMLVLMAAHASAQQPTSKIVRLFAVRTEFDSGFLDPLLAEWNAAGQPDRQGWYIDAGIEGLDSAKRAAQQHAYSLWGVTAFVAAKQSEKLALDVVVPTDSPMQRVMVCVVVNPAKFPHANVTGGKALQSYLLSPATQARIAAFRYDGIDQPVFLPAGRNNENPVLQAVTK